MSLLPLNMSIADDKGVSIMYSSSNEADMIFADYTHTQSISSAAVSYYAANDTVGSNISLRLLAGIMQLSLLQDAKTFVLTMARR